MRARSSTRHRWLTAGAAATAATLAVTLGASARADTEPDRVADAATAVRAALPAAEAAGLTVIFETEAERTLDANGATVAPDLARAISADVLSVSGHDLASLGAEGREVQVQVREAVDGWAFGVAAVTASTDRHGGPQGWLYVAELDGQTWTVGLEGEAEFASMVAAAPLLEPAERDTLVGYATADDAARVDTDTGLRLPYALDASWSMPGGPHAWDGGAPPYSSIDLAGGDGVVRAAEGGTAYSMCYAGGGWIRVIHDNGYSTDYYHLWNAGSFDGQQVGEGDALGDIGEDLCAGGSALAPHVHFSLREYDADLNGWYVTLDGKEIGGWTFHAGESYYGSATHGGETAYAGDSLYNYGDDGGGDPGDPPTDAEVWSDGDAVNLRSGPGTDYDVVGTVFDEDPVSIECTATGTLVEGMDGPTDLWDQLSDGTWISDGFVWTGTNEPVEEAC